MSGNVVERRSRLLRGTAVVFLILPLSNVAGLCIGWSYSGDVRTWWPFILVVYSGIALGYSVLFSAAMRASRTLGNRFAIVYNVVLALTLMLYDALFYTSKIDWLAVNIGLTRLNYFETVVHSDATVYAIYGAFLVGAWIIAGIGRLRGGG
jgi:hypothetical protein